MTTIYCQGKFVPQEEARVSASDHGFLYGASLFETFRTYDGEPFLLEEHIERLLAGCRAYDIVPHREHLIAAPPGCPSLRRVIRKLLSLNNMEDAVFRYTLSAGDAPAGPPWSYQIPTEVVFVRPLPINPPESATTLHILNTIRTEPEVLPRPKSGQYANSLSGMRELRQRNAFSGDEGLMLTRDGRLSEGTVSNLFLVSGTELLTPSPAANILPGITRKHIISLAKSIDLKVTESDLGLCELTEADAIFTTNSVRGIVPIHQVKDRNDQIIWTKRSVENPAVQRLFTAYGKR